jgi:TetR/AcrR family transcriptional repressor of nem operon
MNTNELNSTANKILDVAEFYTQTRGFNAFSYKDIQNQVGVKTSSIHYYFPTKHDLAVTMATRFNVRLKELLKGLTQMNPSATQRIEAFNNIHVDTVSQGKFCLCGMLASDMDGLPEHANEELDQFFAIVEGWLAQAIKDGQEQGEMKADLNPEANAAAFLATIEGGMLIARAKKDPIHLKKILAEALARLKIN